MELNDTGLVLSLLGYTSSGAGEKSSARCLGTKHSNQRTDPHYTCTHTQAHTHAQARHGGKWVRSEGQTTSHHGNNITATAVGLTSTSGPKPLLLRRLEDQPQLLADARAQEGAI